MTASPDGYTTSLDLAVGVDERVERVLSQLTLAEKLAQLGSYWADERDSDAIIAPSQDVFEQGRLPMEEAVKDGLGHLTRVFGTRPVTAAEGAALLAAAQRKVIAANRLRIPAIAHEECLTGFTTLGATVYPTPLAWGATFDPDLVERVGAAIGSDLRAAGVHQGLAPVLDVTRDYRWGRVEETIGEDPYLVGMIGTAYVRGIESAGVIATLKHFAGYSASTGGRNHAPVALGPRQLADVILPPFEMAVRLGGARSVMNSYADIDGVPVAADPELLTRVLREEWGFTGTVVSDYWSIPFLKTKHGVVGTVAEAGRAALSAGLDVELPDTGGFGLLEPFVVDGSLDEALVDRAARRVLRQKVELGLLDADWAPEGGSADGLDLDSPANRALAREAAEKSIVLLENAGAGLPLTGGTQRIALVGPCADDPRAFLGCYSYPIHVLPRHPEHGLGLPVSSLPDALAAALPDAEILTDPGCPLTEPDRSGFASAVALASSVDVVIAVVGDRAGMFGQGTSGEGCDATDLHLPGVQGELVEALLDSGTPVVVLALSGRPYALGAYRGRAAAIVQAFMPGVEAGPALAAMLSGRIDAGGRLPVEIPADVGGTPHTYLGPALLHDGDRISNVQVAAAFPFGHGLSYGSTEWGPLEVDKSEIPVDGVVEAALTVRSTADRTVSEVVQLYAHDPVAAVARPVRELVGFARLELEPGESARVRFVLHADRFSYTRAPGERIVEAGAVELFAARSSSEVSSTVTVELAGPTRRVLPGKRVLTTEVTIS